LVEDSLFSFLLPPDRPAIFGLFFLPDELGGIICSPFFPPSFFFLYPSLGIEDFSLLPESRRGEEICGLFPPLYLCRFLILPPSYVHGHCRRRRSPSPSPSPLRRPALLYIEGEALESFYFLPFPPLFFPCKARLSHVSLPPSPFLSRKLR